ncbi:MAG: DUF4962 domain-containing protein [Candidatus Latescibacter sp.]|nr:DUF4962 domain-containing protein [Candidatus Latescibacter sp.]
MKKVIVFLVSTFLCSFGLIQTKGYAAPDRVPFTINDNFETGEMYAWESYPYAQDIGYEPFTICQQEPSHNGSNFSLGNIRRAWDIVEVYQGFTKEIDLWTAGDTRLKAAVFLTADRKPATLDISLCLFDGSRYFRTFKSPDADRWLELDIPVREFAMNGKPLAAGAHIQAVTIMATYPVVNHLSSYNINLDDFSLNGERQRRFVALEPKSTNFEMYSYSILNRHFYTGDAFGITVRPEEAPGKYDLTAVSMSLIDPSGKAVVSGVPLKGAGGAWKAESAYSFKPTDPRGQWRVELVGKDASGTETAWGFRFIMPGNRLTPKDHPRIFFTADELKKRLAGQSEAEKKLLDSIISGPDQFKNVNVSEIQENDSLSDAALTGGPFAKTIGGNWGAPINRLTGIIESGALRYAFTGDAVAGQKAKEALLKLCSFKRWNHPWQLARGNWMYYPVGYTIGPVAAGYDLLYPLLSESEKKAVRDGLMDKGFKMFYRDMVEMNRMPSSVTNHIAVIVANLAVAATAVYGEDPSNPSFEPYFSGILAKMKRFMDRTYYPDGGYGEPVGYENMATRDIVEALFVLEKNFGIDYTTTTNLKDMWLYPIHGAYSNGRMPDYGDTGVRSGWGWTGNPFQWLSYRTKNPYTAYFTQAASAQGGRGGDLFRWLTYHQGLETKSREEFIPSHHFPVKGTMFLRSGWSDEGTIMVFKSGPNSNHYHIDQGSIILQTNGEILLSEASLETFHGYHAYYGSTFYPFYTTQAMGHNVMLVDTDPESQMPADYRNGIAALQSWPQILHSFAGWNADEVEGDLTCVYKGKLEKYTRSFLFMKPDIIFMYDRVKSPQGHSYQWLFHAEDTDNNSSIVQNGNRVRINRPKARLIMDVLAPVNARGRIRLAERDERFLQLESAENLTSSEFLAVLVPSAIKDSSDPEKKVASTLMQPQGWTGAKVEQDNAVTFAFFRTGNPGSATVEGFTTDAERFAAAIDKSGEVSQLFVRNATGLSKGGVSFKSKAAVSASVLYKDSGADIEVDASSPNEITITLAKAPVKVTSDGKPITNMKYDASGKKLWIPTPQGHTVIMIR